MSAFVTALRAQIEQAQHALHEAHASGDATQVHRTGARLLDLLDRAATHAIDTTSWVTPETLAVASEAAGSDD